MTGPILLKAPAKINWFLIVKGLRDDGYHEIESLMQKVSVYDELTFEPSDKIEIITEADIPLEENLIYKAVNLLKDWQGIEKGVRITLRKEIPIAAGLGGGSSDAATAIIGLNELWRLNLSISDMIRIGVSIGSDVPFFFSSPAAIVRGRGDIVSPVKLNHSYPLVLVNPYLRVETRWAYSEIDRIQKVYNSSDYTYPSEFISRLKARTLRGLRERNDLEEVVILRYPEIGEIKERLKEMGATFSIMSGSGPTVIGVFETYEKADRARAVFLGKYWCRVAETLV